MSEAPIHNSVLIVDDKLTVRRLIFDIATKAGYQAYLAENGLKALEMTKLNMPSVIIMDIKMPVMDGLETFKIIHQEYSEIPVILMTAYGTIDTAIEAMKMGAFDYLVKPSNVDEIRNVLARALQMRRMRDEETVLKEEHPNKYQLNNIIGRSALMQNVYKIVGRVAQTNATVLITGESGSGKELIAKTIHNNSVQRDGPFIKVNCGALPEGLVESELFGYEKGAFTGAIARKPGRFERANKGTIFLDEVGELPPLIQVKLLRVLQEKEFDRVGGTETIKVDVRIIAATNRNLEESIRKGEFRDDLYYRLKVVPIHVPPLRQRAEDIPLFIDHFIRRFAFEAHLEVPLITSEAMNLLCQYSWPGNVRELANVLERAVILSQGIIDVPDLPGLLPTHEQGIVPLDGTNTLKDSMRRIEKEIIAKMLKQQNGNKVKTAQALDISRRALLYKIVEHGLGKKSQVDNQERE
ncbi:MULTISPECIES: sigma-54 dependent transcriptional regulator [Sporomusa]|jgi:two-component system response regulator AtoC|uniref:sigma-54-dependent transcriptional regulator n=1 Tax=Sporomusa TaxID=2375 RepID=UPI00202EC3FB|nr:sigma-54 dependent transcriptional regulator [Sporomusa sphaeroides]MCM0759101.1 sigma-54 dependent transcriptional regulator [Sporomusa sphaeroides DSM 2875]HML33532.1 sigma-54 dependent transcriptional regulator [Sporomusa sphaeroides]